MPAHSGRRRARQALAIVIVIVIALAVPILTASPALAATRNVVIRDFMFDPPALTISIGDTVLWTWDPNNLVPTSWLVPLKKWRRACENADRTGQTLYIKVFGKYRPTRRAAFSDVITVQAAEAP